MKALIKELIHDANQAFKPPGRMTVSEHADTRRILSNRNSPIPGPWQTKRVPYVREIQDCVTNPRVQEVIWMASCQVAKTEFLLNTLNYYMDQDPSPIMLVLPTKVVGEDFSKKRIDDMIKSCPNLTEIIMPARKRDSNNTRMYKEGTNGCSLKIAGSESAASLSSDPIRIAMADEVDRFAKSAGKEGDPIKLLDARTRNFYNRKKLRTSTPTMKGASRIEALYDNSDRRKYWVPCLHCGTYQLLMFDNVKYENNDPTTAQYVCPHCSEPLTDSQRVRMLQDGEWRAEKPFKGIAGFWINSIYSPFVKMEEIITEYIAAVTPNLMRVFVNTWLGETYEMEHEKIESGVLQSRVEDYQKIPAGVGVLTAAIDVQGNRVEILVVGWGVAKEIWAIEHEIFEGVPTDSLLWENVAGFLKKKFYNDNGYEFTVQCCTVDTGAYTEQVYRFIRGYQSSLPVTGIKGKDGWLRDPVARPTFTEERGCELRILGVDLLKEAFFGQLKVEEHGENFIHFNKSFDAEFFEQITSEKLVKEWKDNVPFFKWEKTQIRNEALDLFVYNMAAFTILNPKSMRREIEKANHVTVVAPPPVAEPLIQSPAVMPKRVVGKRTHSKIGGF